MTNAERSKIGRGPVLGSTRVGEIGRRSWLVPLGAAVVLALVGAWAASTIESSMKEDLREELATLSEASVQAVTTWLDLQKDIANAVAGTPEVRRLVQDLVDRAAGNVPPEKLIEAADPLERRLERVLGAFDYEDFVIVTPQGRNIACTDRKLVGSYIDRAYGYMLERVNRGESVVSPPVRSPRKDGEADLGPTIVIAAPVRNDAQEVIAGLGFTVEPTTFTAILTVAQRGESLETYAFNDKAQLVSHSRFESQLRKVGLLEENQDSVLNVELRDPGGDLTAGYSNAKPLRQQPYTLMFNAAVGQKPDTNVDGYRDYRGVEVIGAWCWLREYNFGITTEIDAKEAFSDLRTVRGVFAVLAGLLLVGAVVLFFYSRRIFRLTQEVSTAQQLGQYTIRELIGQGAMGRVYRARHAMLRRPTAVKVLSAEQADEKRIKRFEREVQLTSRLTHPNTIQIFDYGRSPDGAFYYAMEFLPGYTLDKVVEKTGPQPEARVVHILRQVAGSLAEAHRIGLIHRDIKPANIMLCERGGEHDTVKVLDFGLVKAMEPDADDTKLTMAGRLIGTPLFLSPESIRSQEEVDGRSDLYSLGVVGYYLLTGTYIFEIAPVGEVLSRHLTEDPELPSVRLGKPLNRALEAIVMQCLAKDPDDRYADATALRKALDRLSDIGPWTNDEYFEWARAHHWETKTLEDIKDSRVEARALDGDG